MAEVAAARVALVVASEHTAQAMRSGDVPVLALAEAACVAAVAPDLDAAQTTVGTHVTLEHLRPSAVGTRVEAEASVVARDDRTVEFEVAVREGDQVVATVTHRRAVVDRERFLARLSRHDLSRRRPRTPA